MKAGAVAPASRPVRSSRLSETGFGSAAGSSGPGAVSRRGRPASELEHRLATQRQGRRDPAVLVDRIGDRRARHAKEPIDLVPSWRRTGQGRSCSAAKARILPGEPVATTTTAGEPGADSAASAAGGEELHAEAAVGVEEDQHEAAPAPLLEWPLLPVEVGEREVRARASPPGGRRRGARPRPGSRASRPSRVSSASTCSSSRPRPTNRR